MEKMIFNVEARGAVNSAECNLQPATIIIVLRRLSGTKFQFQTATRSIRHGPETPPPSFSSVVPNTREVHLRPTFEKFIHPYSICSPLVRMELLPIRNSRLQQSFFVVRRQVAGPPQSDSMELICDNVGRGGKKRTNQILAAISVVFYDRMDPW